MADAKLVLTDELIAESLAGRKAAGLRPGDAKASTRSSDDTDEDDDTEEDALRREDEEVK